MKIKFLGTGGAFDVAYLNSAAIVSQGETSTLIDCGFTVLPRLIEKNLAAEIDRMVVTHLHDDHVGSLSGFILYRKHVLGLPPLTLLFPDKPFKQQIESFLSFSLGGAVGYVNFVDLNEVPEVRFFNTFGEHVPGMQTWGYCFTEDEDSIVYSGDLGNPQKTFEAIDEWGLKDPVVFHEVSFGQPYRAHTHYLALTPWLEKHRIFGYHCDPSANPADNRVPLVYDHKQFLI